MLQKEGVEEHTGEEAMRFPKRRWCSGLLWVLAGLSIAVSSRAFSQSAEPALIIPSPSYDMGAVWEGETISHAFEVKNEGTAKLEILEVKPG
jgi:hypothetical protein